MKGNFLIRKPVVYCNLLISCRATVPRWNLFFFLFSILNPSFSFTIFFTSPLTGTLHLLPIFMSLTYFLLSLYSITHTILISNMQLYINTCECVYTTLFMTSMMSCPITDTSCEVFPFLFTSFPNHFFELAT